MDLAYWLFACEQHLGPVHIAFHEAGHAVAAVELEFDFTGVMIAPPHQLDGSEDSIGGGVLLTESDATAWVPQRPEDASDFLLAGTLTELAVLKHFLPDSYLKDKEILHAGMGWTPATDRDAIEAIVQPSRVRLKAALAARLPAIRRVADALIARVPALDEMADWAEPVGLSADEVRDLVRPPRDTADLQSSAS